jgi:hypothetical protein
MLVLEDAMNKSLRNILHWTPRIAGILFVLFISLFALDVFDSGLSFWETVAALLIHLIPSILLAVAIAIAWKREWFGALLFIGWAVWYVSFMRGFDWIAYVVIAGLPALIGLFFLVDWIWREKIRSG